MKALLGRQKPRSIPTTSDLLAGLSVTLVLIPQALAYAELAGLPPVHGLFAAAVPAIAAAFFASSPYLQTGPVALTSLLAFGVVSAHAEPGSIAYIAFMSFLALIVGLVRLTLGLFRLGEIVYLMSEPVLLGFTSAAGLLILASQLPTVFDVVPAQGGIVENALWTLARPWAWHAGSLFFAFLALVFIEGGRRLSPFFPGVLVAVIAGVALSTLTSYTGAVVGDISLVMPSLPVAQGLPWATLTQLLIGGTVIAVVGFAEVASISRHYATEERQRWSPNREFISQGMANLAAGLVSGFPVGGSFSRSAVNRQAGAKTRWSGAITGLLVLALLPLVGFLAPLPRAVLGAIVISAVIKLVRPLQLLRLRRYSRPQFAIALTTFVLVLSLEPRLDLALVMAVLLSMGVHLYREVRIELEGVYGAGTLHLTPRGVLWFGSAAKFEEKVLEVLASYPETKRLVLHFEGLGRIDLTGAFAITRLIGDAQAAGIQVEIKDVPPQAHKFVAPFWEEEAR
jgi:SulP family sulfate permease